METSNIVDLIKQETSNDYLAWSKGELSWEELNDNLSARRALLCLMIGK